MGAGKSLKACLFHSVARSEQVKPHPGLMPRAPGLAADDCVTGRGGAVPAFPLGKRSWSCGRECAQSRECLPNGGNRKIHIRIGGRAPEAEAQRALRELGAA